MPNRVTTALVHGPAESAVPELISALRNGLNGRDPALVIAFASTQQPLEEVTPALSRAFPDAVVVGASTAGEFTEAGAVRGGIGAMAVAGDFKIFAGLGTGLRDNVEGAVQAALADQPAAVDDYPYRTAIMLLDPLSGRGEEATMLAAALLGRDVKLAGGAAGDDLEMRTTHVGVGTRVASDGLVLASLFSKDPLGVGVCHGHEPLSPPLKVTRAEGAVVYELEGRPAWDVWVEHTAEAAARAGLDPATLSSDAVGAYLLRYEAGLRTAGETYKIRAPLSRGDDGELSFACGVPEGAVIQIMETDPERQRQSARCAAGAALSSLGERPVAGALVFDCICRSLVLGDGFGDAVRDMSHGLGGAPLMGFATYGEIALDAGDMSGFHNTTSVVLAFPA